jgi:hypothetical protein
MELTGVAATSMRLGRGRGTVAASPGVISPE